MQESVTDITMIGDQNCMAAARISCLVETSVTVEAIVGKLIESSETQQVTLITSHEDFDCRPESCRNLQSDYW